MAALTGTRDTKCMGSFGSMKLGPLNQKGSTTVYQGGMVAPNGAFVGPAVTATGRPAIGVMAYTQTNAGADGAKTLEAETGIFKMGNSAAGDAITDADIGTDCYVVDDQTVAKTNGTNTRSKAGRVIKVDADGVWVLIAPFA